MRIHQRAQITPAKRAWALRSTWLVCRLTVEVDHLLGRAPLPSRVARFQNVNTPGDWARYAG